MQTMNRLVAIALCAVLPLNLLAADDTGYKVKYDGGSIAGVKAGNDVKLYIEAKQVRVVKSKEDVAVIPAEAITEISYGQDVHRRIGAAIGIGVFTLGIGALMALTKSKKHFVGITWDNNGAKGGFAMQVDKDEYRGVLLGLEGVTGKTAVNSETMSVKN